MKIKFSKKYHLIDIPKIENSKGNLSFIESNIHVPFNIERSYYLYDIPGGAKRGAHAHKNLEQFLIAVSGSFNVIVDDGFHKKTFKLNRPYFGLYLGSLLWRSIEDFSSGSVCLVLASLKYDESDYIRNYNEFLNLTAKP